MNWTDNVVFGISSSDTGFACSLSAGQETWSKDKSRMTLSHPVKSYIGCLKRSVILSGLRPNLVCSYVISLDKCPLQFQLYIFLFVAPFLFCCLLVGCGDSVQG